MGLWDAVEATKNWMKNASAALNEDKAEPISDEATRNAEGQGELIGKEGTTVLTPHGWMCRAGCFSSGNWTDPIIEREVKEGHRIARTKERLLPLYCLSRTPRLSQEDSDALDIGMKKYAAAGCVRGAACRWSRGLDRGGGGRAAEVEDRGADGETLGVCGAVAGRADDFVCGAEIFDRRSVFPEILHRAPWFLNPFFVAHSEVRCHAAHDLEIRGQWSVNT